MTCTIARQMMCRDPLQYSRAEAWAFICHCLECPSCNDALLPTDVSTPMTPAQSELLREILADPELGGLSR